MGRDYAPSGEVRGQQEDPDRESEGPKAEEATHREWYAGTGCP